MGNYIDFLRDLSGDPEKFDKKAEEKLIAAVYDAISIVFKKLLVKDGD